MLDPIPENSQLRCDHCGYDLRAQTPDGNCPECGYPVAESQRLAVIPRRPKWRDSDPRWRRRMIAGAWVLTFVPMVEFLQKTEWTSSIRLLDPFHFGYPFTLSESYVLTTYECCIFIIGIVLLFSKERNRRLTKLDRTRPFGILCSYGVAWLAVPHFLFLGGLVMIGIAALSMNMPLRNQPAATTLFVKLGAGYLLHGPHSTTYAEIMLCCFSPITMLLACVPLYTALRSTTTKWLALSMLIPLLLGGLILLIDLSRFLLHFIPDLSIDTYCPFYFNTQFLLKSFPEFSFRYILEASKWLSFFTIALWLTAAQIKTWHKV